MKNNKIKKIILIISIICLIIIAAAIVVTVVIKNSFIGKNKAEQIALSDVGFNNSDVSGLRSELDFDDGHFQYEVEFYGDGIEYEYTIEAKDGDIISRDIDNDDIINPNLQNVHAESNNDNKNKIEPTDSEISNEINRDEAKAVAAADAGLSESEVTFTKAEIDNDDFIKAYELDFHNDESQYYYKINAETGAVIEKSVKTVVERWPNPNNASEEYIDVEKAKEIALNHAGFSNDEVRFSEAKLDNDNNIYDYEISFYKNNVEYDYTIDAVTGNIIEYDIDND